MWPTCYTVVTACGLLLILLCAAALLCVACAGAAGHVPHDTRILLLLPRTVKHCPAAGGLRVKPLTVCHS